MHDPERNGFKNLCPIKIQNAKSNGSGSIGNSAMQTGGSNDWLNRQSLIFRVQRPTRLPINRQKVVGKQYLAWRPGFGVFLLLAFAGLRPPDSGGEPSC